MSVMKVRDASLRYYDDAIFANRRHTLLRLEELLDPDSDSVPELEAVADVTEVLYSLLCMFTI